MWDVIGAVWDVASSMHAAHASRGLLHLLHMLHMRYVGCCILYVGCYILYVWYTGDMWAVTCSNPNPNHWAGCGYCSRVRNSRYCSVDREPRQGTKTVNQDGEHRQGTKTGNQY